MARGRSKVAPSRSGGASPKAGVAKANSKAKAAGKKKGKRKKSKKSKRAPPEPLPDDPWGLHRSLYGGKMSPNEEWERIEAMLECLAQTGGGRARASAAVCDESYATPNPGEAHSTSPSTTRSPSPTQAAAMVEDAVAAPDEEGGLDDTVELAENVIENQLAADLARERLSRRGVELSSFALTTLTRTEIVILELDANALTVDAVEDAFSEPYGSCWLRSLSLSGNRIERVPRLSGAPKLLRLSLDANPLRSLDGALAAFESTPQLRALSLAGCPLASLFDLSDAVVAELGGGGAFAFGELPHLKELDLARVFPAAELLAAVEPLRTLRRLTSLGIAPAEPLWIRRAADVAADDAAAAEAVAARASADDVNGVEVVTAVGDAAVAETAISAVDAYASAAKFLSQKLSCLKLLDSTEVKVVIAKPTESLQEVRRCAALSSQCFRRVACSLLTLGPSPPTSSPRTLARPPPTQVRARAAETGEAINDGESGAGCSCIYGNPCVSAYNCLNWGKRTEIARAARERLGLLGSWEKGATASSTFQG